MLILAFISFNIYVMSRAFDLICMEKARYKFLIVIIIIASPNPRGYFRLLSLTTSACVNLHIKLP